MKFDTVYPADSVEFCPYAGSEDVLVCGTYKLLENETRSSQSSVDDSDSVASTARKRIGKTLVLRVTREGDLTLTQEVESSAVLDLKWSSNLLGIAESEGRIGLMKLKEDKQLQRVQTLQCRSPDTLCLSLDWSNGRDRRASGSESLLSSFSDGSLSVFHPGEGASYSEFSSWHAHDYEPWVAAWDYWHTDTVFSGGDDLKLKGWDIRTDRSSPIFENKRFEAGVTSIQSNAHVEHLIAVGSYDSTVRLIDVRKPHIPLCQADVGGGAWRVKWHPNPARKTDLLAACMHDGFKVVRFSLGDQSGSKGDWEIVSRFDGHESLAYGVDWSHRSSENDDTQVVSCSFYDHLLCTWKG